MKKHLVLSLFGMLLTASQLMSAVTYFRVTNYHGRNQNPFLYNSAVGVVYLQDFEAQLAASSNVLTTPNAVGWNGSASAGPGWGVKEDYDVTTGNVQGEGLAWGGGAVRDEWKKDPPGFHFDFARDEFGRYPEFVGAALIGYEDWQNTGGLFNSIFVYDNNGNEITGGGWKFSRPVSTDPDAVFTDFEGIFVPGGISSIHFRDFAYIDHLTYGYAPIPESSAVCLAGLAAVGLLNRRARPQTTCVTG